MRKISKLLSFVLVVILFISIVPISASASYKTSGTCGNNVRWTFDENTGTLAFSGTGDIQDFFPDYNLPAGTWFDYRERITNVVVGDGITRIGRYCFENCTNLTSIVMPDSITSIGYAAFTGCYNLTSIPLGKRITTIDDFAFVSCRGLTSITLPDGLKTIGANAFANCESLTSIIIPDSVVGLGDTAFSACENLASVTIGDGIKTIDEYAFCGCSSLEEVVFGDNVTTIGENAFSRCESLKEITLPDTVTTIEKHAFQECTGLTRITIPAGVSFIREQAFFRCDNLQEIIVHEENQKFSNDEYGVLFNKDKTELVQYPIGNKRASYIIPDSVTAIRGYSFSYCNSLTSVTIPDSVKTIGGYAFTRCSNLADIIIGEGVTKISYHAMSNCTSLKSVTIPDSVTIIDDGAFFYCSNLESVIIPVSVSSIEYGAFSDCYNLKDVYYEGTREQWNAIEIDTRYSTNAPLFSATIHYNYKPTFTGIKGDYFYKDDVKQKAYQLVEFEGDYYFINDYNKIAKNKRIYLSQRFVDGFTYEDGTPLKVGYYEFDENGKMIIKNGVVGDYFYKNGVRLNAYQLVEYEGDFYFINDSHKVAKNKRIYLSQSFVEGFTYADGTPLKVGYYEFDENGKMVMLNGPVGDYFYKNNVRLNAYQLVEFEGNYYFINDSHKLAKSKRIYLSQIFVEGTDLKVGYYDFDADGKLIIK